MSSRHGLEIRGATGADVPALSELLELAGLAIPPRLLAERLEAVRMASGTALLAMEWGPPSGLVLLHWYPTLGADLPIAQITMLLVGPDERRRGIGRLLVKAASQAARVAGCGALELLVPPELSALREFGLATGFGAAGERLVRTLRKKA